MDTLLAIAVLPGFLLMLFFYKKDEHEPEPREKVLKVLGWGAAVSIVALVIEVCWGQLFASISESSWLGISLKAFVVAALTEELCKYWVVKRTIYDDPEFNEPYDGIVYCVAASLGFAVVENVLFVLAGGLGVGILRAFLAVPAHALFGVFMGYYVGLAKLENSEHSPKLIRTGIAIAVFTHGLYDFVIFSQVPLLQLTVLPMMGVFWMIGLAKVRKHVAISPFSPENRPEVVEEEGDEDEID